ncbi:uncharacterized protein EAF01_009557 [Botrytis porri]|nr:uncharacterized protein EAF01_009557 [Botrytis porri]KAF7895595.1 hypothetical protein EAF01_009557 [Botrytis porri]
MRNQRKPMKRLGRARPATQRLLPDITSDTTPALEASTNMTESTPSSTQDIGYDSLPNAAGRALGANYPVRFPSIVPNGYALAPVYLRQKFLDGFPIFKDFPREIQLMIWKQAVDVNPRNIPVGIMPQSGPGGFKFRIDIPIPEGPMACKDYYETAKKGYSLLDDRLEANDMSIVQHLPSNFWFNPAIDRFCPVQEWSPHNFEVGLKLFFQILRVSKIAIDDYVTDDAHHIGEKWQKFFHVKGIRNWSPHVKDIIYSITFQRLNTDVELTFVPNDRPSDDPGRFYFEKLVHIYKHWDQILDAKRGYKRLARLQADQKWEDEMAEKVGKPTVKLTDVPQWLFDVESDWSLAKSRLMIETRTFTAHKLIILLILMPQWR